MRRRLLIGLSLLVGLAGVGTSARFETGRAESAQESTPAVTPGRAACTVAPRSLADLLATPIAEPVQVDMLQELPEGEPVEPATAEGVTRTVRQLGACASSGDLLRFLALFTDAALVQLHLNTSEEGRAELAALGSAAPTPYPPGRRAVFAGPWHLRLLPDGRVLAAVTWFGSEADTCVEPNRIWALIFVDRDGRWLVDEIIERVAEGELIDLVGLPPAGSTPTTLEACEDGPIGNRPNDN